MFEDVADGACEVDGGKLLRLVDLMKEVEFEELGCGVCEVSVEYPLARFVEGDKIPEPVKPTSDVELEGKGYNASEELEMVVIPVDRGMLTDLVTVKFEILGSGTDEEDVISPLALPDDGGIDDPLEVYTEEVLKSVPDGVLDSVVFDKDLDSYELEGDEVTTPPPVEVIAIELFAVVIGLLVVESVKRVEFG